VKIPFAIRVLLACVLGFARLNAIAAAKPQLPNVIFILADDLGWKDLGCYGSTFYETPNLDSLAKRGMRFTDAYAACCVCSPTRASILTGKYPARLHLTDWLPGKKDSPELKLNRAPLIDHLPLEQTTFATRLQKQGYKTAFMGKWHLGSKEYFPEHHGFDINIAGCGRGSPPSYFSPYGIPTLKDGPPGEYLTDRLTDEAVNFLKAQTNGPFLLYLSHYAVHVPLQAKPEKMEKYKAKAAALPKVEPEFARLQGGRMRLIQNHAVYASMIESLDESIGRVLKQLDDSGLATNTIVIFTSDNGGLSTAEGSPTSNYPLKAGKGWAYEGGVREPLLVAWPGQTKPGSVCAEPIISTDYFETILQWANVSSQQPTDGRSLIPLLKGGHPSQRALFWHYPHYSNQGGRPYGAIRDGDFKLIEWYEDMRVELYNLRKDISEQLDVSAQMPEKVSELRDKLHAWRKSVDAATPTPNPNYSPKN